MKDQHLIYELRTISQILLKQQDYQLNLKLIDVMADTLALIDENKKLKNKVCRLKH